MSKITLGQRHFPTLGLRSQQPKNYVDPTLSCYLGNAQVAVVVVWFGCLNGLHASCC